MKRTYMTKIPNKSTDNLTTDASLLNQELLDAAGITVKDLGVLLKTALQKDNPKLQDAAIRLIALLQSNLPRS